MGAFESSRLPEQLQSSWNNASQILNLGGIIISGHPIDPSKYTPKQFKQFNYLFATVNSVMYIRVAGDLSKVIQAFLRRSPYLIT